MTDSGSSGDSNSELGFEVRESSIGGTGPFALQPFRKESRVHTFELGRVVTRKDPPRLEDDERPEHRTLVDGRFHVVHSPECYLNHSCDRNAYMRFTDAGLELLARRDISEGEELTIDYLIDNSGGGSWPCECGAARYRGMTCTSFFELPPEIQREYLPLLAL
jgi:SET domain-containing protein